MATGGKAADAPVGLRELMERETRDATNPSSPALAASAHG